MSLRRSTCLSLLVLAGCQDMSLDTDRLASGRAMTMGKPDPAEVATWKKAMVGPPLPDRRYLHAAVFDENRQVMIVFGGMTYQNGQLPLASQEIWEWHPSTGSWVNVTPKSPLPSPRSGAAMAFDAIRNKVLIFGGRAGSGFNLEDTWEWDPATGRFRELTSAGDHPTGRSQASLVFEKASGKFLLFGGGRSDPNTFEGWTVSLSLGDTWEWDPATLAWTKLAPAKSPSARHDTGLVWDELNDRAMLFGGLSVETAGVAGTPKQDTWEWDPQDLTWRDLTTAGSKPSSRYAHAMAFDPASGKIVLTGGFDIGTGGKLADVWEWNLGAKLWELRRADDEPGLPPGRMYGTLVANPRDKQLILFGGQIAMDSTDPINMPFPPDMGPFNAARDVWQYDPGTATFKDRSARTNSPGPRAHHAQAYCPKSGTTVVFGGLDEQFQMRDDTWEWDGKNWTLVPTKQAPSPRMDAAMAYDPARGQLLLYGGQAQNSIIMGPVYAPALGDTWAFDCGGKTWMPVKAAGAIDPLFAHGMVTDSARGKVLLFAGMSNDSPAGTVYREPFRNEVWEWDGTINAWTNRSPDLGKSAPSPRTFPVISFDEPRKKLVVYENTFDGFPTNSIFWEWDTTSGAWTRRDSGDTLTPGGLFYLAFDSIRQRHVFYTNAISPISSALSTETWELDTAIPTWYVRRFTDSPRGYQEGAMTFDVGRRAMVMFGGNLDGIPSEDIWEYRVEGGTIGTGGSMASGGSIASGGTTASGGIIALGGVRSGGFTTTGGIRSGGFVASGGIRSGGFVASGGVRSGGFVASGGVRSGGFVVTGGIRTGATPVTGGFVSATGGIRTGGIPGPGGMMLSGGNRAGGSAPGTGGARTGGTPTMTGGFPGDPIAVGKLHRSGCYCDLGQSVAGGPGLPLALVGLGLVGLRGRGRRRR